MNFRILYVWIYFAILLVGASSRLLDALTEDELQELRGRCRANDGEKAHCAGTMISDRHVLSAAHCFVFRNCENGDVKKVLKTAGWKVYYGGGCLPFAKDACSKFQRFARSANVRRIVIPQDYLDGPCFHNDVALVVVKLRMAPMNEVACVAQPGDKFPNVFTVYSRGSDPTKMRKVTSLATVNLTYINCPQEDPMPGVKDDQLCTSEWTDMNMCSGDSGSGLMYKSGDGTWFVGGVASAGTDCRSIDFAHHFKKKNMKPMDGVELEGGVFMDIRKYTDFLCKYIGLCFDKLLKEKKINSIML